MADEGQAPGAETRTLAGRVHAGLETNPVRLTILYLVFGFLALFVFDVVLGALLRDPLLWQMQLFKGAFEVVLTGGVMYLLLRASRAPLREMNEELERQNEELSVLHRVLRHNLRNDLNVIEGNGELLVRTDDGERRRDIYERIDDRIDRMLDYTMRAARIRQVKERSDQSHEVDLAELLPRLLDEHPAVTDDAEIALTVPDRAVVVVNPLFSEAVSELVRNAVIHTGDDAAISITVDPDRSDDGLTAMTVRDDGPGVPDYVSDVFHEGQYDQLLHLDGLGLWFVYWTITDMGGEFSIESDADAGTAITLKLPRSRTRTRTSPVPG